MTAGFGHIKAGQALLDYAEKNLPNVTAEHIDIANIDSSFKKYSKIYDAISKKFPFIWGTLYAVSDFNFFAFLVKKINIFSYFFSGKIKKYIYEKNPDAIIFTNVIPLPLFAFAFRKMFPAIVMGVVVTDYHGHSYYNFSCIDYYFVANKEVGRDLEKSGVKKEKIVVTGIPINPKFYIKENIGDLKLKYGINNDFPVVLLIASFKISKNDLVALVRQLIKLELPIAEQSRIHDKIGTKINLIFIANKNKEFYDIIKNSFLDRQNLLLVNWTDVMEEYMKISDVVISKAGGLTVSECLALKKPMIMVNPIPGQEEYNAEFVERNNFGREVFNVGEIIKILPEVILSSKTDQMNLIVQENPCKKVFQYLT